MLHVEEKDVSAVMKELNLGDVIGIKDRTEKGENVNRIFIVQTSRGTFVLKVINESPDLIGEEEFIDVVYDSLVHSLVSEKLGVFIPERELVHVDETINNAFNSPFIIQGFIQGQLGNEAVSDKVNDILCEVFFQMLEVYTACNNNNSYGYLGKDDFGSISFLKAKEVLGNMLDERATFGQDVSYIDFVSRYFENDVAREAPEDIRESLLQLIATWKPQLEVESYVLVHADLKPSNFILMDDDSVNVFDWSRAMYGDWAQDVGDLLVSSLVYGEGGETISLFESIKEQCLERGLATDFNDQVKDRIKFYMAFKLFSIARVFYKDDMFVAGESILEGAKLSLADFISTQKWVVGKTY